MLSNFTIALVIIVISVVAYLVSQRKPKRFPPGPWGIPLLGHLPFIGMAPYNTLANWKKSYGPIVGFDLGSFPCVLIADYYLIKEALNKNSLAGRPPLPIFTERSGGVARGIAFCEGPKWREQRSFTVRRLRDFGFAKSSVESIMHVEIIELIAGLKKDVGIPINTSCRFNGPIINALWVIIGGQRFDHDDPRLEEVLKTMTGIMHNFSPVTMLSVFIPWIAKVLPDFISRYSKAMDLFAAGNELVRRYIETQLPNHVPGQEPKHFIDAYLDEVEKTTDRSSTFHKDNDAFTTLLFTCSDLFTGGIETAGTTLVCIFLYMANYPHIQNKLAYEIQHVVEQSRLPSLADRPNMPYTEAVIHEVMRIATISPFSLLHCALEDVEFHGYLIPKGTTVMTNMYDSHNSVEIWGDPANFRPERFLSEDESEFQRHDGFLAFSTGKRVCFGEQIARDEIFLYTTALLQTFKVSVDPENPNPSLDMDQGLVCVPKAHKLVFSIRHDV